MSSSKCLSALPNTWMQYQSRDWCGAGRGCIHYGTGVLAHWKTCLWQRFRAAPLPQYLGKYSNYMYTRVPAASVYVYVLYCRSTRHQLPRTSQLISGLPFWKMHPILLVSWAPKVYSQTQARDMYLNQYLYTGVGEPPLCMSCSALFGVKRAIENFRAEIKADTVFTLGIVMVITFMMLCCNLSSSRWSCNCGSYTAGLSCWPLWVLFLNYKTLSLWTMCTCVFIYQWCVVSFY